MTALRKLIREDQLRAERRAARVRWALVLLALLGAAVIAAVLCVLAWQGLTMPAAGVSPW